MTHESFTSSLKRREKTAPSTAQKSVVMLEKELAGSVNHQEGHTIYSCAFENKIREYDISVNDRELNLVNGADSTFFTQVEPRPTNLSNLLLGTEAELKHICLFK